MIKPPGPREMQLAREQIERLTAEFSAKRASSIALAVIFVLLGGVAVFYEQPMLAFCSIVIALIFVLRCIDSHGQLQEIRSRSTKTLYSRVSVLEDQPPARPSEHGLRG
jgi:hypothetical protein